MQWSHCLQPALQGRGFTRKQYDYALRQYSFRLFACHKHLLDIYRRQTDHVVVENARLLSKRVMFPPDLD